MTGASQLVGRFLLFAGAAALVVAANAQDRRGRGERGERKPALKAGDVAPDAKLLKLGTEDKVNIADARGKRPVVLIFGSYT